MSGHEELRALAEAAQADIRRYDEFLPAANPAARVLALCDEVERLRAAVGRVRVIAERIDKGDVEFDTSNGAAGDMRIVAALYAALEPTEDQP